MENSVLLGIIMASDYPPLISSNFSYYLAIGKSSVV
jgi:hypothetical protein